MDFSNTHDRINIKEDQDQSQRPSDEPLLDEHRTKPQGGIALFATQNLKMLYHTLVAACFFLGFGKTARALTLPQFVVTDIDVAKSDAGGRIEFHGLMKGTKEAAVILKNVVKTERFVRKIPLVGRKHFVYTADLVDPEQFQAEVDESCKTEAIPTPKDTKTLLCLHGFATQPDSWLKQCSDYPGNATIIPIIWAAADFPNPWKAYWADRNNAQQVGDSFAPLLACTRALRNKSLMCHSMGNFVLRWAADANCNNSTGQRLFLTEPDEKFRDIFMVAPDTDRDLFAKQPQGQCILDLVTNRVHVLYSKRDIALRVRQTLVLRRPALGLRGDPPPPKAVNVDCTSFSGKADRWIHHSYQFHPNAVRYYETLEQQHILGDQGASGPVSTTS